MTRYIALIAFALAAALPVAQAMADAVRPVQILVRELPSGAFDVQCSVPKVMAPQAMPSPRLPDGCTPDGERILVDRPSVWLTRQTYRCPDGLAGQELGIHYPIYNIGLSTLLRVEFLSGARYAHILEAGEESWQIPDEGASGFAGFLLEGRQAVIDGVVHFFRSWVHIVFLLAICLVGGTSLRVRLATAFLLGQLAGVVVTSLTAVNLGAPLAEIGVAVATVLVAREVLRPAGGRKQLAALAACAGVVHGLGLQNVLASQGQDASAGVLFLVFAALGMDAALLLSVTVLPIVGRLVPRRIARTRLATSTVTYTVAGVACALAMGAVINGPAAATRDGERRLQLPPALASAEGAVTARSRRVASTAPDAAIQSFVSVERFEVRHEILVRLQDVAERMRLGTASQLGIARQDDIKETIAELVFTHVSLDIDGAAAEPIARRVDFLTVNDQGVLPRPAPVPEPVASAWVGVTAVYLTKTTARDIALTWEFVDEAPEVPVTVTDPESSISATLSKRDPAILWRNELVNESTPINAMAVEPARFTLPILSLVPLAIALVLVVAAIRRRSPLFNAFARVMLALAIVVGPVRTVAIALPWSTNAAPGAGETRRILAGVLSNIYRALEFREETAVFDRLALSVSEDAVTEVYLDQRKVLEAEERGGARARVEAVEILDVSSIESASNGGFAARVVWTVGGTVTHFGHRHFRQNRYDARMNIVPEEGAWKLQSVELLEEERLR